MLKHSIAAQENGPGRRFGFTLIELLVVVAIIALLISVLLPALHGAREQSKSAKCLANLRTMGQGIALYSQDQRGMLPGPLHPPIFRDTGGRLGDDEFDPMNPDTERPWFLLARLAPFLSPSDDLYEVVDEVATCPTAFGANPDDNFRPNVGGNPSWSRPFNYLVNSWSNSDPKWYFGWTNIGVTWQGWINGYAANRNDPRFQPPKTVEKMRRVAEEWSVGDAWWDFRRVLIRPGVFQDSALGTWQLIGTPPGNSSNSSNNPLPRAPYHANGQGTNIVYFDGHAGQFKGIDIWVQKFPANRPEGTAP